VGLFRYQLICTGRRPLGEVQRILRASAGLGMNRRSGTSLTKIGYPPLVTDRCRVLSGFDECSKCGWSTSAYAKQLRQRRGMCGRGGLADPRLTERVSMDGSHWPGCSSSASSAVRWWGSSSANPASNAVAAAVNTNGPAVGLQFISGTHVPLVALPTRMSVAGSVFPVKWMAQGSAPSSCPSRCSPWATLARSP
jgi:hypothetical protein